MRKSAILGITAYLCAATSVALAAQQSNELGSRPASEETASIAPEPQNLSETVRSQSVPKPRPPIPKPRAPKVSPAISPDEKARRELRDKVNSGLVGIVIATEAEKPTLFGVSDFFGSLEQDGSLRVFQIPGKGSSQNILELGLARGIDAAVIQSDVLASVRNKPPYPGVDNYLQYVAKLYGKEVHLLAGSEVNSIEDLKGKKVNFGPRDSDNFLTATNIFRSLNIEVEPTELDHTTALERLRQGDIAALIYVATKPADLLNFGHDEKLHLISVPEVRGGYTPTKLTSDDYTQLIESDKPVQTLTVWSVLMVYNWPAKNDRYKKVSRFVEMLLNHTKVPAPQIDVHSPVPGWTRFAPAERWLNAHVEGPTKHAAGAIDEGISGSSLPPAPPLSRDERVSLFKDFVEYQKYHVRQTAAQQDAAGE
jgi:hypothetical protein